VPPASPPRAPAPTTAAKPPEPPIPTGDLGSGQIHPKLPGPPRIGTDLARTRWRTDSIAGTPAVRGTALTIEFLEDGYARGEAGCNRYVGPYATRANNVVLGPFSLTKRECPAALANQEQRYITALEQSERMELKEKAQVLLVFPRNAKEPLRFERQP
jgi:heat shock protein HslJ